MHLYFLIVYFLIWLKLYISLKNILLKKTFILSWLTFLVPLTLFFILRINIYFVIAATELFDLVKTLLIFIKIFYFLKSALSATELFDSDKTFIKMLYLK